MAPGFAASAQAAHSSNKPSITPFGKLTALTFNLLFWIPWGKEGVGCDMTVSKNVQGRGCCRLAAVLALALLAACGGRTARVVAERSGLDDQLTCAHLQGELSSNAFRLNELGQERNNRNRDSVGFLLMSPLFIDLSDTEKRESEGLLRRNARLQALAIARGCSPRQS